MATTKKTGGTAKTAVKKAAVKAPVKKTNGNLSAHLQDHFGFDGFKGSQERIIESIMGGTDTFVIMPTGGGKR